jgi:hypothetical protein
MALCRTTVVSKGVIRGELLFVSKRVIREIVFVSKQRVVFKFCHIHSIKTISKWFAYIKNEI